MIPTRRRLMAVAVVLLMATTSCSVRVVRPDRFPVAVVDLPVRPYRQQPERCGPHALAGVIRYLGDPVTVAEISDRIYEPAVKGTLTMDMFLEARRRGHDVQQGPARVSAVVTALRSERPVIALLRYPAFMGGVGHYVVVRGYSLEPPGLFILWGDGRVSWMAERDFDSMWERSGRWMLSWND